MQEHTKQLFDEMEIIQTKDEILVDVLKRCLDIFNKLESVRSLTELRIFIVHFNTASDNIRSSVYHTDSLKSVFIPPTIVINADFLLELEAVFRSFDLAESLLGCQYIRSDNDLFGLVKRIRDDPSAYLARLRRIEQIESKHDRAYIIETLTMVILFFINHEIGHLFDNVDGRNYATFVNPGDPLEYRIANSVVKLCRHVDEFAKYGFDLPGGQQAIDKDSEIRQQKRELAKQIAVLEINHEKFFNDEVSADQQGTQILIGYLEGVEKQNLFLANQYRYVAIKGLFAAAVYSWYRDLLIFGEKMGLDGAPDSRTLTWKMMQNRETYIQAASLFGEVHRFTLLRAVLTIEAIIRSGSDFFDQESKNKTIWWSHTLTDNSPKDTRKWWQKIFVWQPNQPVADQELLQEWWQKESLQRYYLLCIMMDTAVKIANIGCATGWIKEIDRVRGTPQFLMMNFEPINAAVERLRRFR